MMMCFNKLITFLVIILAIDIYAQYVNSSGEVVRMLLKIENGSYQMVLKAENVSHKMVLLKENGTYQMVPNATNSSIQRVIETENRSYQIVINGGNGSHQYVLKAENGPEKGLPPTAKGVGSPAHAILAASNGTSGLDYCIFFWPSITPLLPYQSNIVSSTLIL